jgi:hypothetical protein
MLTVLIHISNEDTVLAEMEELPKPSDQYILCINPRKKDGKDLHYLSYGVSRMIIPWWRVTFIEIIPTEDEDDVFTFIRE